MTLFSLIRLAVLAVALAVSLITLGLTAHALYGASKFIDSLKNFARSVPHEGDEDLNSLFPEGLNSANSIDSDDKFAIETSVLSILVLLPMILLSLFRKPTITSAAWFELGALSVLWILWLSLGAVLASSLLNHIDCSIFNALHDGLKMVFGNDGPSFKEMTSICREAKAVEALAFINWIILLIYSAVVAFFAFTAMNVGVKPWFKNTDELVSRSYRKTSQIPSPMATPRPTLTQEDTKEQVEGSGYEQNLSYSHHV